MPEEIHLRCVYCKQEFNVEWQGRELTRSTGVCGKKECIKKHKMALDAKEKRDDRK